MMPRDDRWRSRRTGAYHWIRAVSIVEVLVAVAILALLGGLLSPVLERVRRSAQISSLTERLRQNHRAAAMYRSEHDGDGRYGKASEMGLTDHLHVWKALGLPLASWTSPCGIHPTSNPDDPYSILWFPSDSIEGWAEDCKKFEETSVLMADLSCNDADVIPLNPNQTKFGIAINLGGGIVKNRKLGDPGKLEYWLP